MKFLFSCLSIGFLLVAQTLCAAAQEQVPAVRLVNFGVPQCLPGPNVKLLFSCSSRGPEAVQEPSDLPGAPPPGPSACPAPRLFGPNVKFLFSMPPKLYADQASPSFFPAQRDKQPTLQWRSPSLGNDRGLPIDLPSALRLVNANSLDVAIAVQQIERSRADHDLAADIWLPTIQFGGQYYRHNGPIEQAFGLTTNTPATSVDLGPGVTAIFTPSDAIFTALAARQVVRATRADLTTTINDTTLAVATAYFNVQQARGELFGAEDTVRQAELLVARTRDLAGDKKLGGIILPLEVNRSRAELARRREAVESALERWRVASAELVRILRLYPGARIDPIEPPHLQVSLIALTEPVDELIPVALRNRPELASQQALVEATLERLRAERIRPLVPSLIVSGAGPGGSTVSVWSGGQDAVDRPYGGRLDINVQVVWTLQNLGLGNLALVRGREADRRIALLALFRIQDRVAAEVVQAYAVARSAEQRMKDAEVGLKEALESLDKNLQGMSHTRLIAGQNILYVRPQEAVAAVTALASAYTDYYGAVGDYNRSQFLLFRALGYPVSLVGNDPANLPPIRPGHDLKRTDPGTH